MMYSYDCGTVKALRRYLKHKRGFIYPLLNLIIVFAVILLVF